MKELTGRATSYSGPVKGCLLTTADGLLVYPVGSSIVLSGHSLPQHLRGGGTGKVSCASVSRSGLLLAVGEVTSIGIDALITVWNIPTQTLLYTCYQHKGKVQSLSFSSCEQLLASVGGPDDGGLVIWDVATGKSLCGSPASAAAVAFLEDPVHLATCGRDSSLNVWKVNRDTRKLLKMSVQLGTLRRDFTSLTITADDKFLYVGSTSGDVAEVSIKGLRLCRTGPPPKERSCINTVQAVPGSAGGYILCGGSDGHLKVLSASTGSGKENGRGLITCAQAQLPSTICSIAWRPSDAGMEIIVGTAASELFCVGFKGDTLSPQLMLSAHSASIHDVTFPHNCSGIVATCGFEAISLWDVHTSTKLLSIRLPGLTCHALAVAEDGRALMVACSDGQIRIFAPQSGSLIHTVHDAHQSAVLSLATSADGRMIITGDTQGYVKAWRLGHDLKSHVLLATMKEHKGAINRIAIRPSTQKECISAGTDGSCIVWDLTTYRRRANIQANACKDAAYCTDEGQIVTAGMDGKIMYWDAFTGQPIRELDAGAPKLSITMHPGATAFACGDAAGQVQLWQYDEGDCIAAGRQHTGGVGRCAFSPDGNMLATVDTHGGMMLWDIGSLITPHPVAGKTELAVLNS